MGVYVLKSQIDHNTETKPGDVIYYPIEEFLKAKVGFPKWDSIIIMILEFHKRSAVVDFKGIDMETGQMKFLIRSSGAILDYQIDKNVQLITDGSDKMIDRYFLYYDYMFSGLGFKKEPKGTGILTSDKTTYLKIDGDFGDLSGRKVIIEIPEEKLRNGDMEMELNNEFLFIILIHHNVIARVDYLFTDTETSVAQFLIKTINDINNLD